MDDLPSLLLTIQAIATWYMTGVIWFVQVVHYPLMARVGRAEWVGYEHAHTRLTTFVVAPGMFVELGTAIALLVVLHTTPSDTTWALVVTWVGAALLAVVWVSTFALQVPLHTRLAARYEDRDQRRLVQTNWIRTLAWSARALIMTALLLVGL